jgi:hypothetical protein
MHEGRRAAASWRRNLFLRAPDAGAGFELGPARRMRLRGAVFLAEVVTKSYFIDLSAYPRWLVIVVGALLLALVMWLLLRLLKVALWVSIFLVLAGGLGWAVWELVH